MGECAYYFKAEFPNAKTAKKASIQIAKFLAEAHKAYDFYQNGRDPTVMSQEKFWKNFEKDFPLVMNYVRTLPGYSLLQGNLTILSGMLDFGQDENEPYVTGTIVEYSDACVWHMADWGPFCDYLRKHFGASKVVYDTEENGCGSLDSLQLYDYAGIVESLLKHSELFPLLLRVHDDLDVMLDVKMRTSTKGKDHARKEETKN